LKPEATIASCTNGPLITVTQHSMTRQSFFRYDDASRVLFFMNFGLPQNCVPRKNLGRIQGDNWGWRASGLVDQTHSAKRPHHDAHVLLHHELEVDAHVSRDSVFSGDCIGVEADASVMAADGEGSGPDQVADAEALE
jgi:hypothetical protein